MSSSWIPPKEEVLSIKAEYPLGTRVEVISMVDPLAVKRGTKGSVIFVDDLGQIHCHWDTGETLALIKGIDTWRKVEVL